LGQIGFEYQIIPADQATSSENNTSAAQAGPQPDGSLTVLTEQGNLRRQQFKLKLQPPLNLHNSSEILLLDHVVRPEGIRLCTLSADGKVRIHLLSITHNVATDEDETELTSADLPLPKNSTGHPDYLLISELGDAVYVGWRDGRLLRYETRKPN